MSISQPKNDNVAMEYQLGRLSMEWQYMKTSNSSQQTSLVYQGSECWSPWERPWGMHEIEHNEKFHSALFIYFILLFFRFHFVFKA